MATQSKPSATWPLMGSTWTRASSCSLDHPAGPGKKEPPLPFFGLQRSDITLFSSLTKQSAPKAGAPGPECLFTSLFPEDAFLSSNLCRALTPARPRPLPPKASRKASSATQLGGVSCGPCKPPEQGQVWLVTAFLCPFENSAKGR